MTTLIPLERTIGYLSRNRSRQRVLTQVSDQLLQQLIDEASAEQARRRQAEQEAEAERLRKQEAIKALCAELQSSGIELDELAKALNASEKDAREKANRAADGKRVRASPKQRCYQVAGEKIYWSGRGHPPLPLRDIIATGGRAALEQYLVNP